MLAQDKEQAEGEDAMAAMWKDTWLQGGGRELYSPGRGTLYEVASRREKKEFEEERRARAAADPFYYEAMGCCTTKSSVEDDRTMVSQAIRDFLCDGTMYRHT